MLKIVLDVAWEDWGSLENFLSEIGTSHPGVYARVLRLNGPAGGWPVVEFIGSRKDLEEFLRSIGFDEEIEYLEYLLDGAVIWS